MSDHEGHRQRLKQRFAREGLENFTPAQVLELVLFYAIPRRDTAPVARALLEQFGSIAGVLEAPQSALEKVPGMGENAAMFLRLNTALSRYYMVSRSTTGSILDTLDLCGEYLIPRFFGYRDEAVCALCLDARCKVLACKMLGYGSINTSAIPIRTVVEFALATGATSLVLAHNHPSGIALPSQQDLEATQRLSTALETVGVILADHIIVADNDFVSVVQSGLFTRAATPGAPTWTEKKAQK